MNKDFEQCESCTHWVKPAEAYYFNCDAKICELVQCQYEEKAVLKNDE